MQLSDLIVREGDLPSLAVELGASEADLARAADAMMPRLLEALALHPSGVLPPDRVHAIVQPAAANTGLDAGLLGRLLPYVTAFVTAVLARQAEAVAGDSDLGGLLDGLFTGRPSVVATGFGPLPDSEDDRLPH